MTPGRPTVYMDDRRAPVQGDGHARGAVKARPPGSVSWTEHAEAWLAYSARYGNHQSAERIAERGGFSRGELVMFLGREPSTFKEHTP